MTNVKISKTPILINFSVTKITELNFFSLYGTKSVVGTSNKYYHMEMQENNGTFQIYTEYGPTGRVQAREYRVFNSVVDAENEYEKILKSKLKKGYKEIDVAHRVVGSAEAQKQTKAVILKNDVNLTKSSLHQETARFVSEIMGATNKFVINTLKCPLGQLTNSQIDHGRQLLQAAKKIVNNNNNNQLEIITNEFYSIIPHNLGSGARGKMEHLLLDSIDKISKKEDDLDTLLDAKNIGDVLSSDNIDDKYKALNSEMVFIDHKSDLFKWVVNIVKGTKASNHRHLGNVSVLNVWELVRPNEYQTFVKSAIEISKSCSAQNIPNVLKPYMERNDISQDNKQLYIKANVLPLFHGTRTQNLPGIIKNGLMIRPAGAIITGGMYGCQALYFSSNSTKSINYTNIKSSYWASGNDDRAYLFLNDCVLGNQKIASHSYQYTKQNIVPFHSVWAIGGRSGVLNDEMMLYDTNQHVTRYVIEFECKN